MRRSRPAQSARAGWPSSPASYGDNQLRRRSSTSCSHRSETMTREALARDPRGHLPLRRLPRQRRHRARQADPHRGRGDGEGRRHPFRLRPAPVRRCTGRSTACRRARWPRRALPCARSPIRRSRPTAAASGRSRCTCRRARLVNPLEPAPVNARTSTIKRITGCIIGALAEVLPERVPARSAGELLVLAFGGRQPRRRGASSPAS